MPSVYILESLNYNKTYVGSTTDLARRLKEHNAGSHNFTKKYKPWKLLYKEDFQNISEARKREKYLKSPAGRRFIKTFFKQN
jgi:putative endonuclease